MLGKIGKQYVPAILRGTHVVLTKSPAVYPIFSHAVEVVTSSVKFSTLSSTKNQNPFHKALLHAPRPSVDLQDWNVHGTTTLSSASDPTPPQLTQMQGWNHHDPLSQILGNVPDRFVEVRISPDIMEMAKEAERIEEEALEEIALSTGRFGDSRQVLRSRKVTLKHPYYPQYASDLVPEAYEMESAKTAAAPTAPEQTSHPREGVSSDYPQGASDLCDVAYQMDHPPEGTEQSKKKVDRLYPQYHPDLYGASDLADKAYQLDHPEHFTKKRTTN